MTAIETMQEADRKMGFCQDNLIPSGYEDSVEDLRQHAEDVRDFYFEGEPDGEGGECAVGSPVEWVRETTPTDEAEVERLMNEIGFKRISQYEGKSDPIPDPYDNVIL